MRLLPFLLLIIIACDPIQRPSNPVIVDGGTTEGSKTTRPRNHMNAGDAYESGGSNGSYDYNDIISMPYNFTVSN